MPGGERTSTIDLPARYYRHHVPPGRPNTEAEFEHVERTLSLPAAETALVLVDCWDDHHNAGLLARTERVIEERLAPTLAAARGTDALVVHCPSPDVAPAYPDHRPDVAAAGDRDGTGESAAGDADSGGWPPTAVRERTAPAAGAFRRREDERARRARAPEWPPWEAIHPAVEPIEGEPVVADGDELHAVLADRGRSYLLYAGFHTNVCVQHRDYGVRAMADRGYPVVLLRDCTCAVESHDTLEERTHERIAVRDVEVQVGWSATGAALRAALADDGE